MPSKPSPAPEVQTLLTGRAFGESPRWHTDRLWFADWGKQQVVAVDLDGHSEVMVQVKFPSFPMCFDWLHDGSLLIVSARDGLLLRRESNGMLVTHADLSGIAKRGNAFEKPAASRENRDIRALADESPVVANRDRSEPSHSST
jgi:sugar lactone lactonase YvrE